MQVTLVQTSVKYFVTVYEGYAEYGIADWESRPITLTHINFTTELTFQNSSPPSLPSSLPPSLYSFCVLCVCITAFIVVSIYDPYSKSRDKEEVYSYLYNL